MQVGTPPGPCPDFGRQPAPNEQVSAYTALPPVICPSLVLPKTEARFMVSQDSLLRPRIGSFDITGTTYRKLLSASIFSGTGLDTSFGLKICSEGKDQEPRAIVQAEATGVMKIYGKGQSFFGTLEPHQGSRGHVLICEGVQQIIFEAGGYDGLEMSASVVNGQPLAFSASTTNSMWRLQVKPGADAVLILACMLPLIIRMGMESSSAGSPAGARSSTAAMSKLSSGSI
jgi:hypothetical protein